MLTTSESQANALSRQRSQLLAGFAPASDPQSAAEMLYALIGADLDTLARPGGGATIERWRVLSEVATHDLSLAKLFESHTDALSILQELHDTEALPAGSAWGVWAAEPPDARVIVEPGSAGQVTLNGKKSWCSGAAHLSHALMTVWGADGTGPLLAKVKLKQQGVNVSPHGWNAVGMAATGSVDVHCTRAVATLVGEAGQYLRRPGFWQGGAGIAACWYGGSVRLAQSLRNTLRNPAKAGTFNPRAAALGKVDVTLNHTAALLRAAATWIDTHPHDDASAWALRVRLSAEDCATQVLHQVSRALGAAPFCKDPVFARIAADLPVFIRQSGAERDACALGEGIASADLPRWAL